MQIPALLHSGALLCAQSPTKQTHTVLMSAAGPNDSAQVQNADVEVSCGAISRCELWDVRRGDATSSAKRHAGKRSNT